MSTDTDRANKQAPNTTTTAQEDPLVKLVDVMKSVKTKGKKAKKNEASFDDNNGGNIFYNWLRKIIR
ncbi:MAG: hypothetical protein KJ967_02735 [Elusimicrobia bacterium]|nr:hypothetical protein [Elusimicrobiota bacterium]